MPLYLGDRRGVFRAVREEKFGEQMGTKKVLLGVLDLHDLGDKQVGMCLAPDYKVNGKRSRTGSMRGGREESYRIWFQMYLEWISFL